MVTDFPDDPERVVGGVAGVARYLVPALVERGCEVLVVVPAHHEARSGTWAGARVEYLKGSRLPGFLSYATIDARSIRRTIAPWQPDLVHVQNAAGWGTDLPWPQVLTIHGRPEQDVLYSAVPLRRLRHHWIARVEARERRRARHVVSINPYVRVVLGDQLHGTVHDIENPIDDAFFDVARRERLAPTVLFLGRIGAHKNLRAFLDAFARVAERNPEARLRVGGDALDPAYHATCVARANEPSLRGRVEFLGSLPLDGVREELAGAACLALPSLQETAPLVIAEAMAAGLPVVASRACGMPYMVEEGETGFLVPPEDLALWAERLGSLLASPETRRRFGERARVVARDRFSAARVAERTVAVYDAVLAEARA